MNYVEILAAVLVPNVLKYVNQASKAGVKQDAATVLTQVQADVASVASEKDNQDTVDVTGLTISGTSITGDSTYKPAGQTITVNNNSAVTELSAAGTTKAVVAYIAYDSTDKEWKVYGLTYTTGSHWINWTLTDGWSEVDATS